MKIIDVIDFYYAIYNVLNLKVEMSDGIPGKYHIFTKVEAMAFLNGYENAEVVAISFQTYYTFKQTTTQKMENPTLYIMYK